MEGIHRDRGLEGWRAIQHDVGSELDGARGLGGHGGLAERQGPSQKNGRKPEKVWETRRSSLHVHLVCACRLQYLDLYGDPTMTSTTNFAALLCSVRAASAPRFG